MNRDQTGSFDDHPDVEEPEMPEMPTFLKGWFIFVAFLALCLMAGSVYVVYLLLTHFGVVA